MVENRCLGNNKGKIPGKYATHSISIIYHNLDHNEILKRLKLSLNGATTKEEYQASLPQIPLALFIQI